MAVSSMAVSKIDHEKHINTIRGCNNDKPTRCPSFFIKLHFYSAAFSFKALLRGQRYYIAIHAIAISLISYR